MKAEQLQGFLIRMICPVTPELIFANQQKHHWKGETTKDNIKAVLEPFARRVGHDWPYSHLPTVGEICDFLVTTAKQYRKQPFQQPRNQVDALLVVFINAVAAHWSYVIGIYAHDLA